MPLNGKDFFKELQSAIANRGPTLLFLALVSEAQTDHGWYARFMDAGIGLQE
jgi:hypothetical protein